jgi:hypothetical protein
MSDPSGSTSQTQPPARRDSSSSDAHVTGDGAISQGNNNITQGKSSVYAGGNVGGDIVNGPKIVVQIEAQHIDTRTQNAPLRWMLVSGIVICACLAAAAFYSWAQPNLALTLSSTQTGTPTLPISTPTPTIPPTPCNGVLTACLKKQTHGCPNSMSPVPGGAGKFCVDTFQLSAPVLACGIQVTMTTKALPLYGYSLWEIEAYGASSSSPNLLLNQSILTTSTFNGNYGSYAVDGAMTTRWDSQHNASDAESLSIHLAALASVDHIVLKWEEAYATEYCVALIVPK